MWIVDSSVWIDYFNGIDTPQTTLLHGVMGIQELGLGDIILCEVLQGFRSPQEFDKARDALLRFPVLPLVSPDLAIKSAANYRSLRQRGITVRKTIDCLIATFAIEYQHSLLHSDGDFDPFAQFLGLDVIQPE